MSEPEIVHGSGSPKPWPLHERVVKTLKGLSPFGVVLGWGFAATFALIVMAGLDAPIPCSGFSCSPILAIIFATVLVVLPVVAVSIGLLGLMTLLRFSLATRLWTAAVAPPAGFVLMALTLS